MAPARSSVAHWRPRSSFRSTSHRSSHLLWTPSRTARVEHTSFSLVTLRVSLMFFSECNYVVDEKDRRGDGLFRQTRSTRSSRIKTRQKPEHRSVDVKQKEIMHILVDLVQICRCYTIMWRWLFSNRLFLKLKFVSFRSVSFLSRSLPHCVLGRQWRCHAWKDRQEDGQGGC